MTDREFLELKQLIEKKLFELEQLQKLYKNETGARFIMPVYSTNRPLWARASGDIDPDDIQHGSPNGA